MSDHVIIDSLADAVVANMKSLSSALIFAPNTTGKTRLAQCLKDRDPDGVMLYNSYVEDVFTWDNERLVLRVNLEHELMRTVETQGLDGAIATNFRAFTSGKIEPMLDFANGEVRFGVHTGDDDSVDEIKISRAEESLFVWCVYYTVLSEAIDTLGDAVELRSTPAYDGLSLAVIDDPVSSMDDVRIVTIALSLADLIKRAKAVNLKVLVETHHALFFNVLFNSLRRDNKSQAFVLARGSVTGWSLNLQSADSPFSYHLEIIQDIKSAILAKAIRRSHFNQFRALLEKTANFLGYQRGWGVLLTGPDAPVLTRVLNLYSHDKFADPDASVISVEFCDALQNEFQRFLEEFKWEVAP